MADDKYVTLKREDWVAFHGALSVAFSSTPVRERPMTPAPLEDTVVIRKQDIFAASGLSAYANAMVAVADAIAAIPEVRGDSNHPLLERLEQVSDYFFEQAEEARHWPDRKVPD